MTRSCALIQTGRLAAALLLMWVSANLIGSPPAKALDQEVWLLLTESLDPQVVNRLQEGNLPADGSIVTAGTISQTGLTSPSLWWTDQQFGDNLLSFWVAHTGVDGSLRRVDLLVDQQAWSQVNYLERYAFITHFGRSAQDFGYHTRVFNWQGELLGAYICDFQSAPAGAAAAAPAIDCDVFLDPFGPDGIRGGASLLDAS